MFGSTTKCLHKGGVIDYSRMSELLLHGECIDGKRGRSGTVVGHLGTFTETFL